MLMRGAIWCLGCARHHFSVFAAKRVDPDLRQQLATDPCCLVFVLLVIGDTYHYDALRNKAQSAIREGGLDVFNGTTLEEMNP